MHAYNLTFGGEAPSADAREIGWIGTDGPAIPTQQWPRGSKTGLPMMHVFTIRLPEEYQRQGAELPGVAFFQGEGQMAEEFDEEPSEDSDDPFLRDVASAEDHPRLRRMEDIIGGEFALIWLTEEELAGGPTAPPEDPREGDEWEADDEGPNAWDTRVEHGPVWQTPREDRNAGKAPVEYPEDDPDAYEDSWDAEAKGWKDWAEPLADAQGHLGGTSFPDQAIPEGLTPYYIEVVEFGGMNLGGGSAQIDLESDAFDWACG